MARASTPAPNPDFSFERHRWKLVVGVVVLLAIGARFESTQGLEAEIVALSVPVVAGLFGLASLRDARVELRRWAGVAALLVLVGSELELSRAFFPGEPLAHATLSTKAPDADLSIADGTSDLEVETHGNLGSGSRSAEERFRYVLERDGSKQAVEGEFSKSGAVRVSRRRAPTSTSSHVVDLDRQSLTLSGHGAIHAHLEALEGSGARRLEVSLRPSPRGVHWLQIGVWVALGIALVVQFLAARAGSRSKLIAWLGAAAVLSAYLPHHFSPSDPLGALIGASFVALAAGGIGGWLLGALAMRVAQRGAAA
jgi:hypothetical protein